MRAPRTAFLGLLVIALAVATLASRASLDDASAQATRKSKHVTGHAFRTAPDVTATIAKPPPPPPNGPDTRATEIPSPVTLPTASRARVRACGEAWRDMKLAGTTGDDDWRDFAFKCLVGKGPTDLAD